MQASGSSREFFSVRLSVSFLQWTDFTVDMSVSQPKNELLMCIVLLPRSSCDATFISAVFMHQHSWKKLHCVEFHSFENQFVRVLQSLSLHQSAPVFVAVPQHHVLRREVWRRMTNLRWNGNDVKRLFRRRKHLNLKTSLTALLSHIFHESNYILGLYRGPQLRACSVVRLQRCFICFFQPNLRTNPWHYKSVHKPMKYCKTWDQVTGNPYRQAYADTT